MKTTADVIADCRTIIDANPPYMKGVASLFDGVRVPPKEDLAAIIVDLFRLHDNDPKADCPEMREICSGVAMLIAVQIIREES